MQQHTFFNIMYTEIKRRNIPLATNTDKFLQFYWEAPILIILVILTILVTYNAYYFYDYNYKYS
jgi:hypothetical protein